MCGMRTAGQVVSNEKVLLCRVPPRLVALPVEHVIETMRPLPVEPLSGMPEYVIGLSIIRGMPVPVVDTSRILGGRELQPQRFVTVRTGGRVVALAVGPIVGAQSVSTDSLGHLPPLVRDAAGHIIAAMGALDDRLLLVLSSAHLVPEEVWHQMDAGAAAR